MFNGMMDPELIRLAQEQMSRMSPADFAKIQEQMMSNPELVRMATENMKNMRPEDLRQAAQQLNDTRPEDMAEIGEKMANASPEEIATMRARLDSQFSYQLNAAQMLKKQGNDLHGQGNFRQAMQKYLLAKQNLNGVHSSKATTLSLACSLNLMSCYLKTRQYDECIKQGSEVLANDAKNVKALYRRGLAYKELGQLQDAVSDLRNAHQVAPDDETIADVLRDSEERLAKEGGHRAPGKLVIEEITEEDREVPSGNNKSSSREYSATQNQVRNDFSESESRANGGGMTSHTESLQNLKDDPEAIRSFQNFISNANPETLAAVSGGKAGEISPDMFKAASNMISKISPEEVQRMLQLASSFQGENAYSTGGSSEANLNSFRPGSMPPNVTPDMLKTASGMMSKMSPDELQKMFEMTSFLKTRDTDPASAALNTTELCSDNSSNLFESRESSAVNGNNAVGDTSSSHSSFSSSSSSQSNFQPSTADLQHMRNQLNDPAMKQMFSSMIKNMSPEMMANMSQQFGMNISQEDAAKVQQAMSSLSPEDLDKMMRWADRMQRGVEGAKKAKNWLLGRSGMILAVCMLILAILLHWLGYIGR